jgi:hypothetical protein
MAAKLAYHVRINGAQIKQYQFDNGYGASVSKPPNRYLWQIGVTTQPDDELLESSPVFMGAIITGLTKKQVHEWLDKIDALESRLSNDD